ncbi:hypothetical protein L9F63_015717, partial [Diploptera punctata]
HLSCWQHCRCCVQISVCAWPSRATVYQRRKWTSFDLLIVVHRRRSYLLEAEALNASWSPVCSIRNKTIKVPATRCYPATS